MPVISTGLSEAVGDNAGRLSTQGPKAIDLDYSRSLWPVYNGSRNLVKLRIREPRGFNQNLRG